MKNQLSILEFDANQIRVTPDQKSVSVLDVLRALGFRDPKSELKRLKKGYFELVAKLATYSFGRHRPTPVADKEQLFELLMTSPSPKTVRFRAWAAETLVKVLDGDITLAASIADRASEVDQVWLENRLKVKRTNRQLNASIQKAGGSGQIYGTVADKNNVAVTGKRAKQLQAERDVKQTRDGLELPELVRMQYLELIESMSLKNNAANGNTQIERTVDKVISQESELWNQNTQRQIH